MKKAIILLIGLGVLTVLGGAGCEEYGEHEHHHGYGGAYDNYNYGYGHGQYQGWPNYNYDDGYHH